MRSGDSNNRRGNDTTMGDAFRQRRNMKSSGSRRAAVMEQGCICSLKESFGFIYCANRVDELFFHFSQVQGGMRAADLKLDDEVEFRVGTAQGDKEKMAGYEISRLKPGTVVWEIEDQPGERFQGIVQKPVRTDRNGNVHQEGVVRVLELSQNGDTTEVTKSGFQVKFTASDFKPEEKEKPVEDGFQSIDLNSPDAFRRSSSVTKGELQRRKSAQNKETSEEAQYRLAPEDIVEFTLVTAKRDNKKYARNITLLQSNREHQRLLKEEELKATATEEAGVITALKGDYGFLRSNKRREEVYFHYSNVDLSVINEENKFDLKEGQEMKFLVVTEDNGRVSARDVRFLSAGSVEFHKVLAEGVTGVISKCPQINGNGNNNNLVGSVRLMNPLQDEGQEVIEIAFHSEDSPGGTYSLGNGNVGLWVREGDILMFDVIKQSFDGSISVYPTRKEIPSSKNVPRRMSSKLDLDAMLVESRSVKLVSCNPAGRSEGIVNVVKDQFGFAHCAERSVDSYFRLYELFPDELQENLRRALGLFCTDKLELVDGVEIQFDLSLQQQKSKSSGNRQGEKDQLKGQRLLLLPPGTVLKTKVIAEGIKGVIQKEDPKQPYSGMIDLEDEHETMSIEERHPFVYKVVQSMLENENIPSFVYPEIQSVKEDDLVMDVVEALGQGKLTCSYLPTSSSSNNGRLIIGRADTSAPAEETDIDGTKIDETKKKRKKRKGVKPKQVKTLRYDKHCLMKEFQDEFPPCEGDLIVCDLVQSRRTGMVQCTNMKIVERNQEANIEETEETRVGLVTEFTPARQFGFISFIVENDKSSKRENMFFHSKNNKIRKGDEVQFQVGIKKGGNKRVAIQIKSVPKGSVGISGMAAKDACHGYVLLEPSHTSLEDRDSGRKSSNISPMRPSGGRSPMRGASRSPIRGGGRWDNVDRDSSKKESNAVEGLILLTKDPSNMFEGQNILKFKNSDFVLLSDTPRRGDLISFSKGNNRVREIRVVNKNVATLLRGRLLDLNDDKATFIEDGENEEKKYAVTTQDVVSCDKALLKDSEPVEALLHDNKLYGICRTKDLFLESKISHSGTRPKLNLTVRKGLGGKIQAQSMMAKGPDKGSNGFNKGWTTRVSKYATEEND
mmetsp:Transcript_31465/g.46406  ORF Transcript_31465/g.46406 Transcript_31465/m.46406 type:complete len:1124 (-) Transcript_31465:4307-7678(-)